MSRSLREQTDLYGALSGLEASLKPFLASVGEPSGPIDAVIDATSKISKQTADGAPVRAGEVAQVMNLVPKVSTAFDKVYDLFKIAREAGYEVAKLVGAPTKGASRPKKAPTDYSGIPDTDIMTGIAGLAPKFKDVMANVEALGKNVSDQVRRALDNMDAGKSDGVEDAKALVPTFVQFRDSVSGYYSILNSMARRVNQLLTNIGHSKLDQPQQGAEPVAEALIVIPWGDEFGEYEGDAMMEAKKTKTEAKKKVTKEELPEGAAGNLPEPSSAPPIGVERKSPMPPMMHVERLVRDLKTQILEGLK